MRWRVKALDPPSPKRAYAPTLSIVLAGITIIFALIHLVRIDTLIPIIAAHIGNVAPWFVAVIVTIEVFALPYLLMLRLSPLFRVLSGLCVVGAPLAWLCFVIWTFDSPYSTGQFGAYVNTPPSLGLLIGNGVWLIMSYMTLWASNYNASFQFLKKHG